jgi:S-(hydroxymethyl)glutathione dehydrogenase/alcohol dehydrogenase
MGCSTFSNFTVLPEIAVAKVNPDAPFRHDLLHRLRRDHRHRRGHQHRQGRDRRDGGVFGLGGIGLNVIQGLKMAGADMIIGVDINNSKKEWGERFGMTHFVNPKEVDGRRRDRQHDERGADQIGGGLHLRCTGNTTVMRRRWNARTSGWGESIIIGVAGAGQEISTRPFQLVTGRSWRGTAFGGARGRTDVPKIVDWYVDGKIEIDPMITHKLPLEEINKGFDLMHEGKSIRAVVVY